MPESPYPCMLFFFLEKGLFPMRISYSLRGFCFAPFIAIYCIFMACIFFARIPEWVLIWHLLLCYVFRNFFFFSFFYFDFILICFEMSMIDFNCLETCKEKVCDSVFFIASEGFGDGLENA